MKNVLTFHVILFVVLILCSGFALAESGLTTTDLVTQKVTGRYYDITGPAAAAARIAPAQLVEGDGTSTVVAGLVATEGYSVDADASFSLVVSQDDKLGTSSRFEQKISGIPVFGSQVIINQNANSRIQSAVFKITENTPNTTTASISAEQAKQAVKEIYAAQNPSDLEIVDPVLVIYDGYLVSQENVNFALLAWKINANLKSANIADVVIIDAVSGATLKKYTRINTEVSRNVADCSRFDGNCYIDAFDSAANYTYGRSEGQPARGQNPKTWPAWSILRGPYYFDTDNMYDALAFTHNYYLNNFARNGANGFGGIGNGPGGSAYEPHETLVATYGYNNSLLGGFQIICPNAFFSPDGGYMDFCGGLVVQDVIGHEYTHAVVEYSVPGGLIYENQSGALNEAFADIFGEAIERFRYGTTDWIMGDTGILSLRDMNDPEAKLYPSHMYSTNFYCGTGDLGGVHTNSTVFAYASKLLATGGANNGCSIDGIGNTKQEAIFYRALTTYFTSTATFNDSYNAVLAACFDLFGLTSFECAQTAKALNAGALNQAGRCTSGSVLAAPDCDDCPLDSAKAAPGTCGCGVSDADTDSDLIADCNDDCDNDPAKTSAGVCGCGVSDADTDSDLTADCNDDCDNNPAKTTAGVCGCGVSDLDTNGNGRADCQDPAVESIVPPAPILKGIKKGVEVAYVPLEGAVTTIIAKITPPATAAKTKPKTKTVTYTPTASPHLIKPLKAGTSVQATIVYNLAPTGDVGANRVSPESPKSKKVKAKAPPPNKK